MREFAKVAPTIWGSKKFKRLNPADQRVYLYLLTSPHAESIGAFVQPVGYMVVDLGMPEDEIRAALGRLQAVELIDHDPDEEVVYIENWEEFYAPTSPNHALRQFYDLEALPPSRLTLAVATDLMAICEKKGWKAATDLLKPYFEFKTSPEPAPTKPLSSPAEGSAHPDLDPDLHQDQDIKNIDSIDSFEGQGANALDSENQEKSPLNQLKEKDIWRNKAPDFDVSRETSEPIRVHASQSTEGSESLTGDVFQGNTPPAPALPIAPQPPRTFLHEEFPTCVTAEDFAASLPPKWRVILNRYIPIHSGEASFDNPDWQRVFTLNFWGQYVGEFPGDERCTERYPTKENWFMCWEHAAKNYARRQQGLPEERVFGSKAAESMRGARGTKI